MTLVKDQYDVWHKAALNFVRDQLRVNAIVGLGGSEGVRSIEVGEYRIDSIPNNQDGTPVLFVVPGHDRPTRAGNVIQHRVHVEVHVCSASPIATGQSFHDRQERFRDLTGRVWNETLNLRDQGIKTPITSVTPNIPQTWDDFDPDGEIVPVALGFEDRDVLIATIPFAITVDRVWIQGP